METICARLKAERMRLGLTQEEMAAAGGVARSAQANYEKGDRSPDTQYLAAVARMGVDVSFVVTGVRVGSVIDSLDEGLAELIESYNQLNKFDKDFIDRIIKNLIATKVY